MAADVHHLDDGVFVGEIHICYTATPGGVGGDAVVAWYHNLSFGVTFNYLLSKFLIFLLLHCQLGRHFDRQRWHGFRQAFKYLLDVAVYQHINNRKDVVVVFLADAFMDLHSIVETTKKHGNSPYNAILALFQG